MHTIISSNMDIPRAWKAMYFLSIHFLCTCICFSKCVVVHRRMWNQKKSTCLWTCKSVWSVERYEEQRAAVELRFMTFRSNCTNRCLVSFVPLSLSLSPSLPLFPPLSLKFSLYLLRHFGRSTGIVASMPWAGHGWRCDNEMKKCFHIVAGCLYERPLVTERMWPNRTSPWTYLLTDIELFSV